MLEEGLKGSFSIPRHWDLASALVVVLFIEGGVTLSFGIPGGAAGIQFLKG